MKTFLACSLLGNCVVHALDNGLARTPQMGYNSWYDLMGTLTETAIKDTADAMVELGLVELGYNYLNVSTARVPLLAAADCCSLTHTSVSCFSRPPTSSTTTGPCHATAAAGWWQTRRAGRTARSKLPQTMRMRRGYCLARTRTAARRRAVAVPVRRALRLLTRRRMLSGAWSTCAD